MIGNRYGNYTVVEEVEPEIRPNGKRRRKWRVQHDDGQTRDIRQDKLATLVNDPLQRNIPIDQRISQLTEKQQHCWKWLGHLDKTGWAVMTIHQPKVVQRRVIEVVWELVNGPIGPEQKVLTTCLNRWCVLLGHARVVGKLEL